MSTQNMEIPILGGNTTNTKIYFSCSPRTDELAAIKTAKPARVLLSYALWKNKSIDEFVDRVDYRPEIMLDSGAYTFFNRDVDTGVDELNYIYSDMEMDADAAGLELLHTLYATDLFTEDEVPPPFLHFITFVTDNYHYIDHIISMDTIGNDDLSEYSFNLLDAMIHDPRKLIPVLGYQQDPGIIQKWENLGYTYIALGGLANVKSKIERIHWVNYIMRMYPHLKFHMLGCQDRFILSRTPNLYSADGTAWNTTASFARDRGDRSKVEAATCAILKWSTRTNDINLSNRGGTL